jgi:hypothetical protein
MKTENPRADLIAVALLVLLITALFGDILVRGAGLFLQDLTFYHFPMKQVIREAMLSGEFPFWNPRFSSGQPMAANPAYEIFYPPQWLILVPSFVWGYQAHILLHVYLAAIGAYLFLRSARCGTAAALLGSISWGLGGPVLSLIRTPPFLFTMAWLPWILFFGRRFFVRRDASSFALAASTLGLQALAGEPTTLIQTWALLVVYALWLSVRSGNSIRSIALDAARAGGLLLAGLALAAVQLIPAADHTRDSVRARGFDRTTAAKWSFPVERASEIVFPGFLRQRYTPAGQPELTRYYDFGDPFVAELFFGVLPLILLAAGAATGAGGTLPVAIITAIGVLIASGTHTPLFDILYRAGLFQAIRYPEKFILGPQFLLCMAGAVLLQRILDGDKRLLKVALSIAILWGGTAIVATLSASSLRPSISAEAMRPGQTAPSPRAYWFANAVRGAALVGLFLAWRRKPAPALAYCFALFTLADVHFMEAYLAPRMPRQFFTMPKSLAAIGRSTEPSRIFHLADWQWWAESNPVALEFLRDGQPFWWTFRNGAFPEIPAGWGFDMAMEDDFDKTQLLASADLRDAMFQVKNSRYDWADIFMSMSNVHYRTRFRSFAGETARTAGDWHQRQPVDFVPTDPYPRYYFADHVEPIGGKYDFVWNLVHRTWSRRTAFVAGPPIPVAAGEVLGSEQGWNWIRLHVRAAGDAFLVISVTPHKYWQATIDGTPAALTAVNLGYQGLRVPAGEHRVALTYRNPLVVAGGIVTVLAMATLACGLAVARITRRRRPS